MRPLLLIASLFAEPETRERYATLGIEPVANAPEQFAEQQAGIRIE